MNSDLFNQIRILPIDRIIPFEQLPSIDPDLTVSDCHLVRDPFLVAPLDNEHYVLLDDTDTFAELISCGVTEVPVQIIGCNQVSITSPRLGLDGFSFEDLSRLALEHPEEIRLSEKLDNTTNDTALRLCFDFADRPPVYAYLNCPDSGGCPRALQLIFETIEHRGGYQPEVRLDGLTPRLMRRRNYTCLLTLPNPTLADIEQAALDRMYYPLRTVSVSTAVRALQIDLSVAVLTSDLPLSEKEAYLRDLIVYRHQSSRTSSYEGRIYLFNR